MKKYGVKAEEFVKMDYMALRQLIRYYLVELKKLGEEYYKDDLNMQFKLTKHVPGMYELCKELHPYNLLLQAATLYHDYGRVKQYNRTGAFNDGTLGSPETDHHRIGNDEFSKDVYAILAGVMPRTEIDQSLEDGILYQIRHAMLLHGLQGKALDDVFGRLDPDTQEIVKMVGLYDDVANGMQCVGYLLREFQEDFKSVARGGFVVDSHSKEISPGVLDLLREANQFNRNEVCKTYADYFIFAAFLAARALKNPKTREIACGMMRRPAEVIFWARKHEPATVQFPNLFRAFEFTLQTVMSLEDTKKVMDILFDHYSGKYLTKVN